MADTKLDDQVADVLRRAQCAGNVLILPPGQLERSLYDRVNKALTNAGGKWNRKAKGHVFAGDPVTKLASMLDTGVSVDEKKLFQAFFTPADIADEIIWWANVEGREVLEPSAGHGALADAAMCSGARYVDCIEVNPEFTAVLRGKNYATTEADFLALSTAYFYDRVVMNPPFTNNQDIKHVYRALAWLKPSGILVSIMYANQDRTGFKQLVETFKPEVRELKRGAFKESGTDIPTLMVKIKV